MTLTEPTVLLVIDVQRGFDDPVWGQRDNPACETNIAALLDAWRERGWPVVFVRHDSTEDGSPLRPGQPGNDFKSAVTGAPDLLVTKSTNSAFYGTPDLCAWLDERGLDSIAITGITTNHCCETTARMAGNLGYRVAFVIDATHCFDRTGPDGVRLDAATLSRVTAANLHGEFADVVTTRSVLDDLAARAGA
ncbi:MAG TPA: cysteine hydrolase family protein [Streptosporangiales bacterium]